MRDKQINYKSELILSNFLDEYLHNLWFVNLNVLFLLNNLSLNLIKFITYNYYKIKLYYSNIILFNKIYY